MTSYLRSSRILTALTMIVATWSASVLSSAPAAQGEPDGDAAASYRAHGVFRLVISDPAPGSGQPSTEAWYFESGDNQYLVPSVPRSVRPNMTATVEGELRHDTLALTDVDRPRPAAQAVDDPPPAPRATGTNRVLMLPLYWGDAMPDEHTQDTLQNWISLTRRWFSESSYGALTLSGEATPWLKIDGPPPGECGQVNRTVLLQALTAARAEGYQPQLFDTFVTYLPQSTEHGCDYPAGVAEVAGSYATLSYSANTYPLSTAGPSDLMLLVFTHELGHTMSLTHANTVACPGPEALSSSSDCVATEYGNRWDSMGNGLEAETFDAAEKWKLGWMKGRVADLTTGGSALVQPLSDPSPALAGVRIRSVSSTGVPREYWLDYRQPLGTDVRIPADGSSGLTVYVSQPLEEWREIDASLNPRWAANAVAIQMRDRSTYNPNGLTLLPGTSWTTPEGVIIRAGDATSSGMSVDVDVPLKALILTTDPGGTVTGTSHTVGPFSCNGFCVSELPRGSDATLLAQPLDGWRFDRWTGQCQGSGPTCTLTMTDDTETSAHFVRNPALTVDVVGSGQVDFGIPSDLPNCAGTCTHTLPYGAPVYLVASPDEGMFFAGWSTPCLQPRSQNCSFGLFEDTQVTARFSADYRVSCTIKGTPGRDRLVGTNGDDVICGLGGRDILTGLGGADHLYGGPGNDTILPTDFEPDLVAGQQGRDQVRYPRLIDINLGQGRAAPPGWPIYDQLESIEVAYGSRFADTLTGSSHNDVLIGGGGKDTFRGLAGDDVLTGSKAKDTMRGGVGRDTCKGLGGPDVLTGCERRG